MKDNYDVKFVRIRGRIVPIKRRKVAEGVGLTTGGLALAGGGGAASGLLLKKARGLRAEAVVGSQNIRAASFSRALTIKDFRVRKGKSGKLVNMGGKASIKVGSQLNMFEESSKSFARKFSFSKRKKAYKRAFAGRQIFKKSNLISSALIGLGVEKLVKSTGMEGAGLLGDFNSEVAGVGSALVAHSVSMNMSNKIGKGISLRKGFSSDIKRGLKKINKGKLAKSVFGLITKRRIK